MKSLLSSIRIILFLFITMHMNLSGQSELQSYKNNKLGISFVYPTKWGEVIFKDHTNDAHKSYYSGGADFRIKFDNRPRFGGVSISYTIYNEDHPYKISTQFEMTDTTYLIQLKNLIDTKFDTTLDGIKTKMVEGYYGPGETLFKEYILFSGFDMIEIRLGSSVVPFKRERNLGERDLNIL